MLKYWVASKQWIALLFLGSLSFVGMPFFSEAFVAKVPFSVFAGGMAILQVNLAFESFVVFLAFCLKE
ncbi:MAG: hypothetical protein JNM90_22290 [Burkholderiales bacterium]|nr:hypothetical protein [Burkholderiales bacterium]